MLISRRAKQNGIAGIIAVLTVLAHAILAIFSGGGLEYANTITYGVTDMDLKPLLDAAGTEIVPVKFDFDVIIKDNEGVTLLGGLDFNAKEGDVLIFRKEDNRWAEVGRYLVD